MQLPVLWFSILQIVVIFNFQALAAVSLTQGSCCAVWGPVLQPGNSARQAVGQSLGLALWLPSLKDRRPTVQCLVNHCFIYSVQTLRRSGSVGDLIVAAAEGLELLCGRIMKSKFEILFHSTLKILPYHLPFIIANETCDSVLVPVPF